MIEDQKIAEQVGRLILDGYSRFEDSMKLVEANCSAEEFSKYKCAVGKVTTSILFNLLEPLYEAQPALKPPGWDDLS